MGGNWKNMFKGVETNDFDLVRYHISNGVDLNYQHPEYFTSALVESISRNHIEMMKFLLDNGAKPDLPEDFSGKTPMQIAKELRNQEAIAILNTYLGTNEQVMMTTTISNTPHRIFLIDGIGALLSIMAALTATQFEHYLGIPSSVLLPLTIVGSCFALFSFTCYFKKVKNWRLFLKNLAIFNLLYCILIAGIIYYFFAKMSVLGVLFFVSEISIIVVLAIFELKIASQLKI